MKERKISRRTAIKLGACALGAAALGLWTRDDILAFLRKDKQNMAQGGQGAAMVDTRDYDGMKLPLLGFGAMRLPERRGEIDEELALEMIDYAYRHGVTYFDTAYFYHGGQSEAFLGRALYKYPRESYFLADKMPGYGLQGPEDAPEIFQKQLDACRTEYFDNYFLHYLTDEESFRKFYIDGGALAYLQKEKERGRIRHLGFSFHGDMTFLQHLVDGWSWDCALIQLNYQDWNAPDEAPDGAQDKGSQYRLLAERHIPIFVMEPVKGGRLASLPGPAEDLLKTREPDRSIASWAMRFVASQPEVVTILSGMSTIDQVVDNVQTLSRFQPLSEADLAVLAKASGRTLAAQAVACTYCRYCEPCPYGVAIADNFRVYNDWAGALGLLEQRGEAPAKNKEAFLRHIKNQIPKKARADMCTRCGKCLPLCPQHIDIPKELGNMEKLAELCRTGLQAAAAEKAGDVL